MNGSSVRKRSHGQGQVTPYRDGFRIRWSLPDGGRSSKVMRPATKTQAERELRRILGEVEKGEHQDDRRGSVTFDAFFEDWLTLRELEVKPSTYKNLQSIHRAVLSPTFGPKKINAITRKSVDLWWAKHKVHPVQRRNSYFALKGAMDQAVNWGLITVSPCQVKHPGKDESKDRPTLSVEEFDAVLAHVPEFYRPVILIMFAGHLRLGEVIALNAPSVSVSVSAASAAHSGAVSYES